MLAKIIAIEGADSCGKTTQAKMLAHSLKRYGDKVALIEIPYNDKLTHKLIYWMLFNGLAKRYTYLFQTIQFINKLICQLTCLLYKRVTCDYVIFARWSLSSLVYGTATGVSEFYIKFLQALLTRPHLTVVLDSEVLNRTSRDKDSYEKDTKLQEHVRELYRRFADENFHDHVIVGNNGARDEVLTRIENQVKTI